MELPEEPTSSDPAFRSCCTTGRDTKVTKTHDGHEDRSGSWPDSRRSGNSRFVCFADLRDLRVPSGSSAIRKPNIGSSSGSNAIALDGNRTRAAPHVLALRDIVRYRRHSRIAETEAMNGQIANPPCAICIGCGATTNRGESINTTHRCDGFAPRQRGTWASRLGNDWKKCPICYVNDREFRSGCESCSGG